MADNFDPEEDARTLTEAESIKGNPDRHKAAVTHIQKQAKTAKNTYDTSRQALMKQTGKRMKSVFGQHAPFEAASGEQSTPFTQAESGG